MTSQEFEAMLSVVLTGMMEEGKARMNVVNGFAGRELKQKEFDENAALVMLDEAVVEMERAIEEVKIFRNMLRDERPKAARSRAFWSDHYYGSDRDIKRSERDPKKMLAAIVARM